MDIKKLLKYIKIVTITAVLFLAGLYFIVRIVTPEGVIEKFYDEPKNSIDVLIVGGSHAMCAVSPVEIYDDTGLTAYNLSTWSQPIWISYHYIKEALKTQSPKVVLIDVFSTFYDRSYLTGVDVDLVSDDYAQMIKPSLNLLSLNIDRRRMQVTAKPWTEYLNITKYHSRITELEKIDIAKMYTDSSTTSKGFGPFYTMEDFSDYEYPQSDETLALYPGAQQYLEKTIEYLLSNDIIPVLVKYPHIASEDDIKLLNSIKETAQKYNIEFLDFTSTNTLNLDFATDFADHGHINNYGAKKVTNAINIYINTLNLSITHTEKITNLWKEASEIERDQLQKMEIRLSKTFAQLISRVDNHNSGIVIVKQNNDSLNNEDYEKIKELFDSAGLDIDINDIINQDFFVYYNKTLLLGDKAKKWCEDNNILISNQDVAKVIFNGENYSYSREGLNVAIYDFAKGEMYHYITFAKEHNYSPYTR